MDAQIEEVLARLDKRSSSEQARLNELRTRGPEAVRAEAKALMLDVGRAAGQLINLLARLTCAQHMVEIGGSVGYSTIWLAEAARATGGKVISYEIDPSKQAEQRENVTSAGLIEYVDMRLGNAADFLDAPRGPLDLVFFDHWPKSAFISCFDRVWPAVRKGGVVLADNMLRPAISVPDGQAYQAHIATKSDACTMVLDVGKGFAVTVRI